MTLQMSSLQATSRVNGLKSDALLRYCPIPELVVFVLDDEDHIESRQDSSLKVDILAQGMDNQYTIPTPLPKDQVDTHFSRTLHVIVSAEDGVGSGEDGGPRVEDGGDASFGDGDGLLLHRFVDGHTVFVAHFVEFIDTDHTAICKYHCAAFQEEFSLEKRQRYHRKG